MGARRRIAGLGALLVVVGVGASAASTWTLYRATLDAERRQFGGLVHHLAEDVSVVLRQPSEPGVTLEARLGHIIDEPWLGAGGTLLVAEPSPEGPRVLVWRGPPDQPAPATLEPWPGLQRAAERGLDEGPGTWQDRSPVDAQARLVAYAPVEGRNWAVVAAMPKRELQAPYVVALQRAALIATVLALLGGVLLVRLGQPVQLEVEAAERRYHTLFETNAVSIWDEDLSGVVDALDALRAAGVTDLGAYLDEDPTRVTALVSRVVVRSVNPASYLTYRSPDGSLDLEAVLRRTDPRAFRAVLCAMWRGERLYRAEVGQRALDDSLLSLLVSIPLPQSRAEASHVPVTAVDITEAKRAEARARRLERAYQCLAGVGHLATRAPTESELLGEVCRLLVETGGYALAWVGRVEHDAEKTIRPIAAHAVQPGYVEEAVARWDDGPHGQGPGGRAVRERRPIVARQIDEPEFASWRALAEKYGYRSLISLPLELEGAIGAVLIVYSPRPDDFDAEEEALLVRISEELAHGLAHLEQRAAVEQTLRELRSAHQALEASEQRFRHAMLGAPIPILLHDADGQMLLVNDEFTRQTGLGIEDVPNLSAWRSRTEPVSASIDIARASTPVTGDILDEGDVTLTGRDGRERVWSTRTRALGETDDGRAALAITTAVDISERVSQAKTVARLAFTDQVTALPNRTLFFDRLEQARLRKLRTGEGFALHLVDLDRFKSVNDSLGHPIGDRLLDAVGRRIKSQVRAVDTVARLGGDEFAVVQAGVDDPADAAVMAGKIVELLGRPFDVDGHEIRVGASLGLTIADGATTSGTDLFEQADLALYRAKEAGRGTFRIHTAAMTEAARVALQLGQDLRRALDRHGELYLDFQPVLRLSDRRIVQAEALLRWRHPIRGVLSPAEFMPVAEDHGLMSALGAWVLREACAACARWGDGVGVSVNLSDSQVRAPELFEQLDEALASSRLRPGALQLEIHESLLERQLDHTLDVIQRLHARGVTIALDDFGTGLSSVQLLNRLPLRALKIAPELLRSPSLTRQGTVLEATVAVAQHLGLVAAAEGIETEAAAAAARSAGCDEGQGFLFARPMPEAELRASLEAGRASGNGAVSGATGRPDSSPG